jgi:hypothetical protein
MDNFVRGGDIDVESEQLELKILTEEDEVLARILMALNSEEKYEYSEGESRAKGNGASGKKNKGIVRLSGSCFEHR